MSDENPWDQGAMRPDGLQMSKMRWYSMGIVAENKKLGSMDVEVTPTEELTMLDGEVTTHSDDYKASAQDTLGRNYESSVKAQATVTASWLRFGDANRMTSPDVRRGEAVMLYQFGDANKFYWMTIKQDAALRRLETVVYAISANPTEGAPMNAENTYFFEWSSHRKSITLSTSKANGEPFAYRLQLNTGDGILQMADDVGNYQTFDSKNTRMEWMNVNGSHVDLSKKELTFTIPDRVTINTKHTQVNSPTITLNGVTNVTENTTMEKNTVTQQSTTILGGLSVLQSNMTGGTPGPNRMRGGFILETGDIKLEEGGIDIAGASTFRSNVDFLATIKVTGFASLEGGYTNE